MEKNISANQIWYKIIKKLNDKSVEYVLVGAAALVIHGLPRSTLDIDIYIAAKKDTLNKLFQIAEELGLYSGQNAIVKISKFPELFANQWICFSYAKQDILDVFLAREDEFRNLYRHSELKQDKTLSIRVASLDDIIEMKKSSGRAVDVADVKLIEEFKKYKK